MTGPIKTALCVVGALALAGVSRGLGTMADMSAAVTDTLVAPLNTNGAACATKVTQDVIGSAGFVAGKARDTGISRVSGHAHFPLHFEINRGQSDHDVAFAARGPGYAVFLTAAGAAVLALASNTPTVVRMTFAGTSQAPVVSGRAPLPGRVHYLRGRDPDAWRTNIPTYARVEYRDLYPGIDLVYYGRDHGHAHGQARAKADADAQASQLEYDLIVAPAADPAQIAMRFEGVDRLDLTPAGDLVLHTAAGELRERKPTIYQQVADARQPVDGRYVRRGSHEVGFEVGPYDARQPLVIDPILAFSTYLGGTQADAGQRIAVDASGNSYLTGSTTSPDFPRTVGGPIASALDDAFVAKVNADGSALVYATYVGGTGMDTGEDIAVDAAGRAYLTGFTTSTDFPVSNAVQPSFGGLPGDAFVAQLSAAGDALVYATYLGGTASDRGEGIAVDGSGHAYVTGSTRSIDFPTMNAFQPKLGGIDPSVDAFVTKLSPTGTALVYSTYLGGGESDEGTGIAVNAAGQAHVVGVTGSGDFPTVRPFQPFALRGVSDAFVTKFSATGASLVYSSNLGGSGTDVGLDIAVHAANRASVVGFTSSTNFPTARPLQASLSGPFDAFVTVVSAAGTTLFFSTYLGGTARDEATGIAADAAASYVYVTGRTFSTDFPVVDPVQPTPGGGTDAFVAKINVQAPGVDYATYLGGEADDTGGGIAVDPAGSTYVIGSTTSDGFPVVNALQPGRAGDVDAFAAKLTDFDLCLQDDQSGDTLQIDLATGGYRLTVCGGAGSPTLGTGRVIRTGSLVILTDRGTVATFNARFNMGFARIMRDGTILTINDFDATQNSCTCP